MITISPLIHRGIQVIRLQFYGNHTIYEIIRKLPTAKYSSTHACWYIPYQKQAYDALKATGIPIIISPTTRESKNIIQETIQTKPNADIKDAHIFTLENKVTPEAQNQNPSLQETKSPIKGLEITYNDQKFYISIPYNVKDVTFLKSLSGSYWNIHQKKWIVRANPVHLKALQEHFVYWQKDDYDKIVDMVHSAVDPMIIELYITPEYPEHFMVKIKGYRPDFSFLKTISGRNYDDTHRRWILPLSPDLTERVINHYTQLHARVINRLPVTDQSYYKETISNLRKQNDLINKFPSVQHDILKKYTNTLLRQQYSWSTVIAYIGPFSRYVAFIFPMNIDEALASNVNDYLSDMAGSNASDSVLNTTINAIKFYFEKVTFRKDFKIEQIKRPRKGRFLPTILSIFEVDRILRGTQNVKHATILYTFYGSGIRLNELLSLKVNDVWWDRNQLLVKNGKGGKDRIVMLSETLKHLLKKYFDEYMPQYWLFEGQDKQHKYSEKSVQQVVKQAASRAGITKKVTPHTLRHCFATHLMDGGVQLPYIQELLGHKDVKTTMIYTHVTTKNVTSVVSPLDQLRMI